MRPEIRRLTPDQFVSLLVSVLPTLQRKITAVHLHHTWRPTRAQFRGVATIEAMRSYHVDTLGWSDIAQHLSIDPVGACWTGRNWNLPPASQKGMNGTLQAGPFMIEIIGDFDDGRDTLDGAQRGAVCAVVSGLLANCELGATDVRFHRELGSPKSCPGSGVDKARLVADIERALEALSVASGPADNRRPAARTTRTARAAGSSRSTLPLPLPLEFLVSRDVAQPVPAVLDALEDDGPREDNLSARAIVGEADRRAARAAGSDLAAVIGRAADEWLELRPHVVNLTEGKLSRSGLFRMDEESIGDIVAGIRRHAQSTDTPRVMLHAHGGLVDERSALDYARGAYRWWLRHGVYPVFFVWETGLSEVLRDRLGMGRGLGDVRDRAFEQIARPLGRPLWEDMKDYALKASAADAGGGEPGGAVVFAQALRGLLADPPDGKPISLHAVGHSAGSILQTHLVPLLGDNGMTVRSLAFLAPAVRIDLFKQLVGPRLANGQVARFEMYTMDEQAERSDDLVEPLGITLYGKSLLYLVSNAFEPERRKAPLLGLEERFRDDAQIMALFGPSGGQRLELSRAKGQPHNPATHARRHGCFDNDAATMRSVLQTMTGLSTTDDFPVRDGECDRVASRHPTIDLPWMRAWPSAAAPTLGRAVVGTRRALCVGIDGYATSPLAGCVHDARTWAQALRRLRYDVSLVLDRDATRQRILDALRTLIEAARPGDSLVFQYSGHGTQADDLNGDESDRYDEALVPVDYTSGALLLDDDLADLYRRLPDGAVLTLFMDCCHSGTNSRFSPLDRSTPRPDERRRFLPLDPELAAAHRRFRERFGSPAPTHAEESLPGIIHFAACLDDQFAYESGGQGHFTRIACQALAAAVSGGDTNERFGSTVAAQVIAIGRPQTPRLMRLPEGLDELALLAGRDDRASAGAPAAGGSMIAFPSAGAPVPDDPAMVQWCLQFFEAGAAYWRQRAGQ